LVSTNPEEKPMKVVSLSRIVDVNRLAVAIQRIRCIIKVGQFDFALSPIGMTSCCSPEFAIMIGKF